MEIDGFRDLTNLVALAKTLHEQGRFELVTECMAAPLDYDFYYETAISLLNVVFPEYGIEYLDKMEAELMTFSGGPMAEYFSLACQYGKRNKLGHKENPYIRKAFLEADSLFSFSYLLDWRLLGRTRNKPELSKLLIMTCANEFCEHDQLAYGLIMYYDWLKKQCVELKTALNEAVKAA